MTTALRSLYRRLVRRACLAAGVRPCRVRIKVVGTRRHCRMLAVGWTYWWTTAEDVRAEFERAFHSARRAFHRRYGLRLRLDGAYRIGRDDGNQPFRCRRIEP